MYAQEAFMHTRRRNIEVEFCIDVRSTHSTASDIVHIMRPPDCLDHTGISSMAGGSDRSCVNSALPVHADVLGKLSAGCRRISFCEAGVVVAVISAVALSSCVAMIGRQPGAKLPDMARQGRTRDKVRDVRPSFAAKSVCVIADGLRRRKITVAAIAARAATQIVAVNGTRNIAVYVQLAAAARVHSDTN